jgi:DNA-binding winged helix-turn-helix (wHTH) protein/Flp pilus assembly protein TadD
MTMLRLGDWLFESATRRLCLGEAERKLTLKAAGVLLALAETPGRVWSRDALLERIWPGVTVGEEVLTHAVAELRKALGDDFRAPRFLETVHKHGYRLLCRVDRPPAGGLVAAPRLERREADIADPELDLELYASYLRARQSYERCGLNNALSTIELYSQVVRTDAGFYPAHIGLAKALTFMDCAAHAVDLRLAFDHCATAHRLKPGFADTYAAEGLLLAISGDFAQSVGRFKTALELNPNSAETHYLFARAGLIGLAFAPATALFEQAAKLCPDDYHSLVLGGKVLQILGDERRALANYARALPRLEACLMAHPEDIRALCGKARCLWQMGRQEDACAVMETVTRHQDGMSYHLASTLARVGESQRALDVLEEIVELGWRYRPWLDRDPDFDALRGNRRFKNVANAIGMQ